MAIEIFFEIKNLILAPFNTAGYSEYRRNTFAVSNVEETKITLIKTEPFLQQIGHKDCARFINNPTFAYSIIDFEPSTNRVDNMHRVASEAQLVAQQLSGLLSFLWFVRDNAIQPGIGVAHCKNTDDTFAKLTSNNHYSNCFGDRMNQTTYTADELLYVDSIMKSYTDVCTNFIVSDDPLPQFVDDVPNTITIKGAYTDRHYDLNNRIERAVLLLNKARNEEYLPFKIAYYMPVFESLFSTESEGVSFKVPQRAANYIGESAEDKQRIFKQLRAAYDIRSRVLHGSTINNSPKATKWKIQMEHLGTISKDVDDLARKIMTKVILKDSEMFTDEVALNAFFIQSMFQ